MNKSKNRSALSLLLWDMATCICLVTALALAVVVFTDWIIPFPENWPR